ncbi:hypothetical protein BFP72_05920 [Reichenbachiella sp. 5M10]|uniref:FKBP-type peptidyl-prolyl cis-trans isomerase n=1 Tax=Reichenbachiella sp. 5M10 TaxID=1889772 RepID=UPI000C589B2A|nr:FKBP-type peptidyl-prolyl cis-trans isomerase [Reichenbachiella sp. 5M10]PIB34960.1 hypothetical protein BFP72_05920 [Reichenbachiella sp. 5M10]
MQKGKIGVGVMVLLTALFTGCLDESEFEKQQKISDKQISEYLSTNGIEADQSSFGIYYEQLTDQTGGEAPSTGDIVQVRYLLMTLDGDTLETRLDDTVQFKFNWNSVIPRGINYGVDILHQGEKIRFYLPSYTAYEEYAPEDHSFAPYSNFIVEMELVDILSEEEMHISEVDAIDSYLMEQGLTDMTPSSSGLYYQTIEAGDGDSPKNYNQVVLHYSRKYLDGTVIQETEPDNPLTVSLASGQLVEGFYEGVMKMKEGEKALLIMPSDLAFGSSIEIMPSYLRAELFAYGYLTSNVKPYAPVIYEVELVEIK